ncbi:helix-turn-helix domain-containing protein [Sphingosinithalassobacter tenebrarum]|uniref:Helix-turn-helix domain-containing protein n=2 Tax=Stakelama tenebrarum TaxID=2711215 RepID=A0A6G6YAQ7_9SPHN|nr:helix-turn-helix domain-containing protein [Sphingosinithalassobacter tenebrarum]
MRLGIMAYLVDSGTADFVELKQHLRATQGNLSIHLRKLEDAGFIAIEKRIVDRKPLTRARLSARGRKAFGNYIQALGRVIAP